jgi:hypothetical protein
MRATTSCWATTIALALLMANAGSTRAQFPTPGVSSKQTAVIRMHNLAGAARVSGPAWVRRGAAVALSQKDTTLPASTAGIGGVYSSSGSCSPLGGSAYLRATIGVQMEFSGALGHG